MKRGIPKQETPRPWTIQSQNKTGHFLRRLCRAGRQLAKFAGLESGIFFRNRFFAAHPPHVDKPG